MITGAASTLFIASLFAKYMRMPDLIAVFLFIASSLYFFKNVILMCIRNIKDRKLIFLFAWLIIQSLIIISNYALAARYVLLALPPTALFNAGTPAVPSRLAASMASSTRV